MACFFSPEFAENVFWLKTSKSSPLLYTIHPECIKTIEYEVHVNINIVWAIHGTRVIET